MAETMMMETPPAVLEEVDFDLGELLFDPLNTVVFDFEKDLASVLGEEEETSNAASEDSDVCKFFLKGTCMKGSSCPFKHSRGEKAVVCKHWLRSLCKKGAACEFLHEFDMSRMPPCYFYTKYGECSNPECMYRHINPEENIKECPWYARGFCKHGPNCRHKHSKKVVCSNYMEGFCPDGPNCKFGHPKYEVGKEDDVTGGNAQAKKMQQQKHHYTCHNCGQPGHKAMNCTANGAKPADANEDSEDFSVPTAGGNPNQHQYPNQAHLHHPNQHNLPQPHQQPHQQHGGQAGTPGKPRPLEQVLCYKCGNYGHYANKCTNKKVNQGFPLHPQAPQGVRPPTPTPQFGGPTPPTQFAVPNPSSASSVPYDPMSLG